MIWIGATFAIVGSVVGALQLPYTSGWMILGACWSGGGGMVIVGLLVRRRGLYLSDRLREQLGLPPRHG